MRIRSISPKVLKFLSASFLFFSTADALAQTSASPYTTGYRYDLEGRVVGTISADPDGSGPLPFLATRTTYNTFGLVAREESGELVAWQADTKAPKSWTGFTVEHRTDYTYDSYGRKISAAQYAGTTEVSVTQFSYDGADRLVCTAERMNPAQFASLPTDACALGPAGSLGDDRITRNTYDVRDHITLIQKAYGTALQQNYGTYTNTDAGRPTSIIDANGNKATMDYDQFGRLIKWSFPDKTATGSVSATDYESYAYDAAGNRTSLRKRDARVINFTYDPLNRMTIKDVTGTCVAGYACTTPLASAVRDVYYTYDLRGLQTGAHFDSASGTDRVESAYDGFGDLTSSTLAMGGTSKTLAYDYDADGNRIKITHPDGNSFVYLYDGLDRPTAIQENALTQVAGFAYNAQGKRASDARGAATQAYSYDGLGRLTGLSHDLAGTTNDVSWTLGYNPASQINSQARNNDLYAYSLIAANKSYAVNGLNQYTTAAGATLAYDANGNLESDGTTTYGYDVENRLVSASSGVSLDYDPLGRLWRVTGPSTLTEFYYDGDALVEERDTNGALLKRYVHGNDEDDPLIEYDGANLSLRRSLEVDYQGSIVSEADATVTAPGALIARYAYDEYGVPSASVLGRFGYTGQVWIPELGIYYYKARMYSSRLGRFLQTDPVGYKDQVNLYAYVANDPVNKTDPTGLYECSGSKEQCGAVSTAYNRASGALKSGDLSKSERTKLQGSLNALGAPGQKNGVTVSFATPKEIAAKAGGGFAYTDKTKTGISVVLPNNYAKSFDTWKNNPASPVGAAGNRFSPGDARANALAHEGTHVGQFERGMTQEQYNRNPTPFEREAYRVGNSVNEAFGTVSPFPEP